MDEGVFQGKERPLPFFDIWLRADRSLRGAIVYQDSKGRWWIDDYNPPFGEQIYNSFFQDGIVEVKQEPIIEKVEVIQKPESVIKKEVIPARPKKRGMAQYEQRKIKESIRGSIFPPIDIPKSWLEPQKKRRGYTTMRGEHIEFGEVDYLSRYELSEIRKQLEHGYSRIA
jgi:hypothetical protein